MASVDFDREAFVPATQATQRPPARLFGLLLFLVGLAALGFLGYKILSDSRQSAPAASDTQSLESVQQQLARIEKRLDQLERHRKPSAAEADPVSNEAAKAASTEKSSAKKTVYSINPAASAKTQAAAQLDPQPQRRSSPAILPNDTSTADREAWQATTDRLADVVGVVGSQEGEIAEAREQLNTLLAK